MYVEVQWIILTDGEREREKSGWSHTVFRWKKNEGTWSTEIEVDGLGDHCAVKITCEVDISIGSRNTACKGKG
jgi:hypothetical protein